MAYVIDTYNKYNKEDTNRAILVFKINDIEYAIKKIKNKWDIPQDIEDSSDKSSYLIYNTYEDALAFVRQMKSFN